MSDIPAFPVPAHGYHSFERNEGMSLRDYYAGQALAGIVANPSFFGELFQQNPLQAAIFAWEAADCMMENRPIQSKDNEHG